MRTTTLPHAVLETAVFLRHLLGVNTKWRRGPLDVRPPARSARIMAVSVTAFVLAAVFGVAGAGPAVAASYQPDGWIRYKSFKSQSGTYIDPTAWVGDNVYNATGRNQKATHAAGGSYAPNPHFVFEVRVQNEGAADRFRIGVSGNGDWVVKYFHGTTDITSSVVAGTYRTPHIPGDQSVTLKVKVWLGDPGTHVVRLVTLTSEADGTKQDAVKVRVSYSGCTC